MPTVSTVSEMTPMPVIESISDLIALIHQCCARGWCPATSSNFSVRLSEQTFAISASGLDKSQIATQDFLSVDTTGQVISTQSPEQKPSAETHLHAMLYAIAPQIQCVVHTHSVNATVLSKWLAPVGQVVFDDYELLKGLHGVQSHEHTLSLPIFANTQDIAQLRQNLEGYYQSRPLGHGFLLAGHGLYTWGHSVADAQRHLEVFEFLFQAALLTTSVDPARLQTVLKG